MLFFKLGGFAAFFKFSGSSFSQDLCQSFLLPGFPLVLYLIDPLYYNTLFFVCVVVCLDYSFESIDISPFRSGFWLN